MTIGDLQAKTRNLRERLVAHAEFHIGGENDSVEMAGLAGALYDLANKLATVNAHADAALRAANEVAVLIGQFQTRMMSEAEYHSGLVEHGRRLRALLNEAGYPAPGSVPPK